MQKIINELSDEIVLALLSSFGIKARDWHLIKNIGGAKVFICSDLFLKFLQNNNFTSLDVLSRAKKIIEIKNHHDPITILSPLVKPMLKIFAAPTAPLVFYARYQTQLLLKKNSVAIVGSRNASIGGFSWTKSVAKSLAHAGITIVSGGAYGIDEAAHMGALESGGSSIIVNPNKLSLSKNGLKDYFKKSFLENICVVYPFDSFNSQSRAMFALRNEYLTLQAKAVLVVEGKQVSGTKHTILFAKKHHVPIFAVPGDVNKENSFIPNRAIKKKIATAVFDAEPLIEFLGKSTRPPIKKEKAQKNTQKNSTESSLPYLLSIIKENNCSLSIEEIMALSGKDLRQTQNELLDFELLGQVKRCGSQFVLTEN